MHLYVYFYISMLFFVYCYYKYEKWLCSGISQKFPCPKQAQDCDSFTEEKKEVYNVFTIFITHFYIYLHLGYSVMIDIILEN